MIYYTGDTHGDSILTRLGASFSEGKHLTKDDYVIVCGDLGLIWDGVKTPKETRVWDALAKKKFTTLFVAGNHENYDRLFSEEFEKVDMFGDTVVRIHDSLYMLQSGHIYTIGGVRILAIRGAASTDRWRRVEGVSWWPQEVLTQGEMRAILERMEVEGNTVDVVVSHASHMAMTEEIFPYVVEHETDPMVHFLTEVQKRLHYQYWVNGHYHVNVWHGESKTFTLYTNVVSDREIKKLIEGSTHERI